MRQQEYNEKVINSLQKKGVQFPDAVDLVKRQWIRVSQNFRGKKTPEKTASELLKTQQ